MYTLARIDGTEAYNWGTEFAPMQKGVSLKAGWYVCSVTGVSNDKHGVERTHIKVISEVCDKAQVFKILNIKLGTSEGVRLLFQYEHLLPDEILNDVRYQSLKALCDVVPYETGVTDDRGTVALYRKISFIVIQEFLRRIVANEVSNRVMDTSVNKCVSKVTLEGIS